MDYVQPNPDEEQRFREEALRWEQEFRRTALPLFGLPESYTRLRLIGDSDRTFEEDKTAKTGRQLTSERYGLFHGDPLSATEPNLQVFTSTHPGPEVLSLLGAEASRPSSDADPTRAHPCSTSILLDEEPHTFEGLESGSCWACAAAFPGYVVTVVGVRHPRDGLALVRIRDPEPYIAGRRDFLQALHPDAW